MNDDKRNLGDIDLEDYLKIVRRVRPFRLLRALALAGACVLAFTAGVLSPLSGKHANRITLEQALATLERVPEEEWQSKQAVFALHTQMAKGMMALEEAAKSAEPEGVDASLYLLHLTRRGLASIQRLANVSPHREIHSRGLERIREDLGPK